jgi:hypothetical protein
LVVDDRVRLRRPYWPKRFLTVRGYRSSIADLVTHTARISTESPPSQPGGFFCCGGCVVARPVWSAHRARRRQQSPQGNWTVARRPSWLTPSYSRSWTSSAAGTSALELGHAIIEPMDVPRDGMACTDLPALPVSGGAGGAAFGRDFTDRRRLRYPVTVKAF